MGLRISVVGAGPGGYVAAIRAAQLGAEVTLIEREAVGGTCLNWGCIPSKVMVTAAAMMQEMRQAHRFGIQLESPPRMDMALLQQRQQAVIATQKKGIETLLRHHKIRLMAGEARIKGRGSLLVTAQNGQKEEILWDRLILATGTRPATLPFLPTDGVSCLSSNDFLRMERLPTSAIVLGAGVVGCEFASILTGLGAKTELVEMADRILPLPGLDPSASRLLAREFKKRGMGIHTEKKILGVEKDKDGVTVKLEKTGPSAQQTGQTEILKASCLIVCIGRSPATGDLGLGNLDIQPDLRGYVPVNESMETAAPDVFAIGDVTGPERIMLAHVASMEGRVAAEKAMGLESRMRYTAVPSAIFTDPEVAFVGLSAEQAGKAGFEARTSTVLFRSLGKAHATDSLSGEAVLVTEEKSGSILGCHLVGAHATELIAEATLAVHKGLVLDDLAETIHAHPTFSEIFPETALKGMGMGLHST